MQVISKIINWLISRPKESVSSEMIYDPASGGMVPVLESKAPVPETKGETVSDATTGATVYRRKEGG